MLVHSCSWYILILFISVKLLVCKLKNSLGEIQNWPSYKEGKERTKKEAGHSRWVSGRVNKQENLYTSLVLGSYKTSRSLHLAIGILKVFIRPSQGSVIYTIQMVSTTSYSGLHFKTAPAGGMVGRRSI